MKRSKKSANPPPQAEAFSAAFLAEFGARCAAVRSRYATAVDALPLPDPTSGEGPPPLDEFLAKAALIYVAADAGARIYNFTNGNPVVAMGSAGGHDPTFAVYGDLIQSTEILALLQMDVGSGIRAFVAETVPADQRGALIASLQQLVDDNIATGG